MDLRHRHADRPQRPDPLADPAEHPFDRCPRDVGGRQVREPNAVQRARRVRQVRRPLPFEIRDADEPFGAGRSRQCQRAEMRMIDIEQIGVDVEDPRRIERADQGQEPAGGIGEARDDTGGVMCRQLADQGDDSRGPQRHGDLTRPEIKSERRAGIVPAPWSQDHLPAVDHHGRHAFAGPQDLRQLQGTVRTGRRRDDVRAIDVLDRVEIPGPGRVRSISGEGLQAGLVHQLPAEPVVRQGNGRRPRQVLRLMFRQPPQLGHRDGGDGHHTRTIRPHLATAVLVPVTEFPDEISSGPARSGVVPQDRVADDSAVLVQRHHAVLLTADGDGLDVLQTSRLADRLSEGP
ncbi:hypothetical protein SDC9_113527 [bioreactor metagenome]|uniref:Uncharacterized protein n=1 Tax=bioreactor metagenome TaxID=1076179 RepID=A0A645BN10_9ZZZZ